LGFETAVETFTFYSCSVQQRYVRLGLYVQIRFAAPAPPANFSQTSDLNERFSGFQ
jgi:hypothetical protein